MNRPGRRYGAVQLGTTTGTRLSAGSGSSAQRVDRARNGVLKASRWRDVKPGRSRSPVTKLVLDLVITRYTQGGASRTTRLKALPERCLP